MRSDGNPAGVENLHRNLETLSFLSQQIPLGDVNVLKISKSGDSQHSKNNTTLPLARFDPTSKMTLAVEVHRIPSFVSFAPRLSPVDGNGTKKQLIP